MKAQVINIGRSRISDALITDNYETIRDSYRFLTRPDGKPLSLQDKRVLDLTRQLIKRGIKFIDYPWLREKLERSNKTINRVFENISLYFTCKFENKYVEERKEFFNKVVIAETIECQNLLDNALLKLADSRYKKADETVHLTGRNCPQGESKLSTPLHMYKRIQEKEIEDSSNRRAIFYFRRRIRTCG